jgi:hypothetical protein
MKFVSQDLLISKSTLMYIVLIKSYIQQLKATF